MILILFGIWLMACLLVVYFSRKVQPTQDEITSTTDNNNDDNDDNDNNNNNDDSDDSNESETNHENDDSEYIGHSSETEDEEAKNKEPIFPKETRKEMSAVSKTEKFYQDPVTGRRFSKKWIASQLPYTKGNHFWLVSRKDLLAGDKKKDSIEVVRNVNTKTVTIRYWNNNRIDGPELIFIGPSKTLVVSLFKKGKLHDVDSDIERFDLVHQAELLYNFYCSSSSYVKNLNLESYFTL